MVFPDSHRSLPVDSRTAIAVDYRLSSLAVLSIESYLAQKVNYGEAIQQFSELNARKYQLKMFEGLNNDSKIRLRQNIIRHRQKLLQYLENVNDPFLKPKIELISNNIEKSNLNNLVSNDIEKSNLNRLVSNDSEKSHLNRLVPNDSEKPNFNKLVSNDSEKPNFNKLVSNDSEKPNFNKLVSNDSEKPNFNKLVSNDSEKPNFNKLVSNDSEKSNLNHHVKPKIASIAELQTPKCTSTIKVTNYRNKPNDTFLRPTIKLVSNDSEKSNLNHNVKPKIASIAELQTLKCIPTIKVTNYRNKPNDTFLSPTIKLVSNDSEKPNFNKLVSNDSEKPNFNKLVSNDSEKPNFNKLVSNDSEKSNLNHHVKPKIASIAELQTPKCTSTIKVTNYRNKPNDTFLRPTIKLVSNDSEKSNLNHNVKPKIASIAELQTLKCIPTIKVTNYRNKPNDTFLKPKIKLVTKDIEKSNLSRLVSNNIEKSNLNRLVSNDIEKSNLNRLVSNDSEKSHLNHNVKPKIASIAELPTPECKSTIKVTNYRNKPFIQIKTYEEVMNSKPENVKVLKCKDIKYDISESSTVDQISANFKVNIQKEPVSTVQLRHKPLPKIQIKEPESPPPISKLKKQLIEELELYDTSSSEENDDNISVGNNEEWNEIFQTHNESDLDMNGSSDSSLIEEVRYDEHKQPANYKKMQYIYNSSDSNNSVSDINYPTTSKRNQIRKEMISPQFQIDDQSQHRFRKPHDRTLHNAKERACRERISHKFEHLRTSCSYLDSKRRVPSKHSILLAAKKECDLLQHFERKMLAEKTEWLKANEILKNRIAESLSQTMKTTRKLV